ncbi:MAG: 8-oxo-dGTP diphosphatase, partial [Anaerolineae bacterium]|nr:8-oxo-dGTP diphosphatase [Anaerolineae bacterium]
MVETRMRPDEQRDATRKPYTVIPRTLVFLKREGQLLLLKGAPTKRLWAGKYNGLGGHIKPGESPDEAARREVFEEAGLVVTDLTLRAVVHVTLPEPPGVILFVFVGEAPPGSILASEEGVVEWIPRDRLLDLPLVEDLPQLLPRILAAHDVVFG